MKRKMVLETFQCAYGRVLNSCEEALILVVFVFIGLCAHGIVVLVLA